MIQLIFIIYSHYSFDFYVVHLGGIWITLFYGFRRLYKMKRAHKSIFLGLKAYQVEHTNLNKR
jgi:hypothetical protein